MTSIFKRCEGEFIILFRFYGKYHFKVSSFKIRALNSSTTDESGLFEESHVTVLEHFIY